MNNILNQEEKLDKKLNSLLITPSWLSGLIAVFVGLLLTVGVIVASDVKSSQVQLQLATLQNTSAPALTLPGETVSTGGNALQTSWPLLVFWGFVGLGVYFIVESFVKVLRNIAELKEELDYVHTQPRKLIRTSIQYLALRLLAIIIGFVAVDLFLKRIVPYSISAAHASASNPFSISAVLYAVLSFIMIALGLHLLTILLRIAVRRPRVFDRASYL